MMLSFIIGILMIGLVTFGGGAVFIPMFEELYVTNMHLFTSGEFATMIAVVNAIPGITGAKLAAYGGYIIFGIPGLLIGLLVISLPSVFVMHYAYKKVNQLKNSPKMKAMGIYIKPIIIAIFVAMIYKFIDTALIQMQVFETIILFVISYYLVEFKKLDVIYLIILAITYGIITYYI